MIPPTDEQEAEFKAIADSMQKVAHKGAIVGNPFRKIFKCSAEHSMLVIVQFASIAKAKKAVACLERQLTRRHSLLEQHARKFLDRTTSAKAIPVTAAKQQNLQLLLKLSQVMTEPYLPTLKVLLDPEIESTRVAFIWSIVYNDEDSKYFGHVIWDKPESLPKSKLLELAATGMAMALPIDAFKENKAVKPADDDRLLTALESKCAQCQAPLKIKLKCPKCKAAHYCGQDCYAKHLRDPEGHTREKCEKLAVLMRVVQRRQADRSLLIFE